MGAEPSAEKPMNTPRKTCAECGAELTDDAARGLCPRCLLQAGLGSQTDPDATVALAGGGQPRSLPKVGEPFGPYRILRLLGRGGMGVVYEAEEQDTGRRVALKVLGRQFDSPQDRARFLREGRLAASINHPNSVYVYGTEEIDGTPTISMELVSGGTLLDRLKDRGPMPVPVAVDAILQIVAGLEAAQAIGILHRDIKPGNCFEDADGTIKIGDFGLSISTAVRAEPSITAAGALVGTPAFCAGTTPRRRIERPLRYVLGRRHAVLPADRPRALRGAQPRATHRKRAGKTCALASRLPPRNPQGAGGHDPALPGETAGRPLQEL